MTDRPGKPPPAFLELRGVALHPAHNGRMRHRQAALGHHLHQVTQTDLEPEIPPNAQDDDFAVEVATLEQLLHDLQLAHCRPQLVQHTNLADPTAPFAPEPAFFRKAIKRQQRCPQTITLDGYAASHRAVRELKADGWLPANTKLRSSKYLNNLVEQDHRGVKQRIAVMLGFKEFGNAAITIAGIELLHRIRKGQFRLGRLGVQGQAAPAVWNAVLWA